MELENASECGVQTGGTTADLSTSAKNVSAEDASAESMRAGGSSDATEVAKRRADLDELLSTTFNSILRTEEKLIQNRLTEGLTITEIHTIVAMGLHEENPMNVVANRLGITLATLTIAINKLVAKGFVERKRCEEDRRKVLITLTKQGRQVYRAHGMFHRKMIEDALSGLTEEEERVLAKALTQVKRFFEEDSQSN